MLSCDHGSDFEHLVDYFAGDLANEDETALEDHWAGCANCAKVAGSVATLVGGATDLVGRGFGLWAITPSLLERFHEEGLQILETRAEPGDGLHLDSTAGIDLLIGRLKGDFAGLSHVDVTFDTLEGVIVEKQVPVARDDEVIIACVLHLRVPPGTKIRSRCTLESEGRLLGEYGLGIDVSPR